MECRHCKSPEVILSRANKHSQIRQYCKACKSWSVAFGAPKVLLLDIETSRTKVNVWRPGKQYVGWKQIEEDLFIICWAAKWLFQNTVLTDIVTPKEARKRDGKRVVKSIHKLLREADCVITHNGNSFDLKELNWQFLKYDLPPVTKYKSIDTYRMSKPIFGAPSLSLDYLAKTLGFKGKLETEMGLWELCEAGDQKALERMITYNINDVFLLEDLYLRVRGWLRTHPNFAAFIEMYNPMDKDERMCPRCAQTVSDSRFTRRWQSPFGYFYKAGSCKHCGTELRKTVRIPNQVVR